MIIQTEKSSRKFYKYDFVNNPSVNAILLSRGRILFSIEKMTHARSACISFRA